MKPPQETQVYEWYGSTSETAAKKSRFWFLVSFTRATHIDYFLNPQPNGAFVCWVSFRTYPNGDTKRRLAQVFHGSPKIPNPCWSITRLQPVLEILTHNYLGECLVFYGTLFGVILFSGKANGHRPFVRRCKTHPFVKSMFLKLARSLDLIAEQVH